MIKSYVTLGGRKCRIEANWGAIAEYLDFKGITDISGVVGIADIKPQDLSALAAACINAGERADGRESNLTPQDISNQASIREMTAFINEYMRQISADVEETDVKKV